MKAVYCDWCGKVNRSDEIKHLRITGMYGTKILLMDLCGKCTEKIEDTILNNINYQEIEEYEEEE